VYFLIKSRIDLEIRKKMHNCVAKTFSSCLEDAKLDKSNVNLKQNIMRMHFHWLKANWKEKK